MPNYFPYLVLSIITLTILITIMMKAKRYGLIVLFFVYSGMVYVAEIFVMVIGNSYVYKPGVLAVPYYDHIVGAIVSNLLTIPALGVVAAVYQLRFRWLILFALSLVGVEIAFLALDIYETVWWSPLYTALVLLLFFPLVQWWLRALQAGRAWVRFVSLWMQAWSGVGTVMFVMSVLSIRFYELGIFQDVYRDDIFVSSLMGMLKSLIFASFVFGFNKLRWQWLGLLLVYGVDLPLYAYGILIVNMPFGLYTLIYLMLASLLLWWNRYAHSVLRAWQAPIHTPGSPLLRARR